MNKVNCKFLSVLGCLMFCMGFLSAQDGVVILGDVDSNQLVNIVDALKTAQYSVGAYPKGFNENLANVNGDEKINILDSLMTAQYYIGLLKEFPPIKQYRDYRGRLEKAFKVWEAISPVHYAYKYNKYCFCEDARYTYSVEVKNDMVVAVLNTTTGLYVKKDQLKNFKTIDGLFDLAREALENKSRIVDLQFDSVYNYPTSISIDYIVGAIDDEVTYAAADFRPIRNIEITNLPGSEIQNDPLWINNALIIGNMMTLNLEYSGGCSEHELKLYAAEGFMESYPVQVNVYIYHEDNDDMCDSILRPQVGFNLQPLADLYARGYGEKKDPIILKLHHYFQDKPGEVTTLTYKPL